MDDERSRIRERSTSDELRELAERARESDRGSVDADRKVEHALDDLDRLAKRIRRIA